MQHDPRISTEENELLYKLFIHIEQACMECNLPMIIAVLGHKLACEYIKNEIGLDIYMSHMLQAYHTAKKEDYEK